MHLQVVRGDVTSGYKNIINMFAHELSKVEQHQPITPRDTKLHFYVSSAGLLISRFVKHVNCTNREI
jgi:hypothetical protein